MHIMKLWKAKIQIRNNRRIKIRIRILILGNGTKITGNHLIKNTNINTLTSMEIIKKTEGGLLSMV
jgi:hypothetical protein